MGVFLCKTRRGKGEGTHLADGVGYANRAAHKVKAAANSHDPNWHEYFESRWGKEMLRSIRGRAKLYRIWRQQDGLCSTCHKPVTKDTPWDVRHIVKRD